MINENLLNLNQIENLVLDEVDMMLEMGFEKEVDQVLKMVDIEREDVQMSFFSATIPEWLENTF